MKMTKEQSKKLGEFIGFCMCGIMFYLVMHASLRGLGNLAGYLLQN